MGNAIIANRAGRTTLSVATSGTMAAAAMTRVCATIDTRTVYFRLPPMLTDGSTNMLSATASSLRRALALTSFGGLDTSDDEMVLMARIAEDGV